MARFMKCNAVVSDCFSIRTAGRSEAAGVLMQTIAKTVKGIEVPAEPGLPLSDDLNPIRRPAGEGLPGIGSTDVFAYPVTHGQAECWLDDFLEQRLVDFGAYEDAISQTHRVMWHGVPTMLNRPLTPQQV